MIGGSGFYFNLVLHQYDYRILYCHLNILKDKRTALEDGKHKCPLLLKVRGWSVWRDVIAIKKKDH